MRRQDIFLRDNIQENDILIVSVGGNDVALLPTPCTIASMTGLICCLPQQFIENGISCFTMPCNDYCCGCTTSLLSCTGSCPPCLGYFRHLFGVRVQKYIEAITAKTKPKKILVCMIYFLDEDSMSPSWAGPALGAMGYNRNPAKLQSLIVKAFEEATWYVVVVFTVLLFSQYQKLLVSFSYLFFFHFLYLQNHSRINIKGTQVIPVPLFRSLDGKNPSDYVARVEPSAQGGRKMADFLLDIIESDNPSLPYTSYQSPSQVSIGERG